MGEEFRLAPSCGLQPLPRPDWVASQSFELLHGPVGCTYSIASLTCTDASAMV